MNVKKDIRFRVYVAFTCICLLGIAIICKAAMIQVKEGKELRDIAKHLSMRSDTVRAERGNIYTENGELLCSSIPQYDIHLDMSVIKKDTFDKYIDTLSRGIAGILGGTKTADFYKQGLTAALRDTDQYYSLCNNISFDKFEQLRTLPIFKMGPRRGGFIKETQTKRINPYGLLAYRTIGLWRENSQPVGLEAVYDSVLKGENGYREVQKMTGGVMMPIEGSEVEAQNGRDVVTTIDLNIQNVAEHALKSMLEQYECLQGSVVVLETNTGKIRAMANLGRQPNGSYFEDFNYALNRSEPGSTFKMATLLSLLNDHYITVDQNVNCHGGVLPFGSRVMKDDDKGLGSIPIRDAYAHSSNCAMGGLAYQYYYKDPQKYIDHLHEFHLDEKIGLELRGEQHPYVLRPGNKEWNSTTLPWMAIGYGVMITPLHTAMLYNGIANNGRMMKPYLVSSIREYGKEVKHFEPTVLMEHMGDSSTIAQLQSCTRQVVMIGTGKKIQSPYYQISGKTGTAQVADLIGGHWYGYKDGVYQGSFVGYFPSDKPKYTCIVLIRTKPHGHAYYGAAIAAPVFRMISDKIFSATSGTWEGGPLDSIAANSKKMMDGQQTTYANYLNVMSLLGAAPQPGLGRNSIAQLSVDSGNHTNVTARQIVHGIVPNVTGMALRDAIYLLENEGMQVQVQGAGRITVQSVAPGTRIVKGQNITLQLS